MTTPATHSSDRPLDWASVLPGVSWLGFTAPRRPPPHPAVLDVVESALRRRPSPLLETVSAALAPPWEELGDARDAADLLPGDVPAEGSTPDDRMALYAAARAVSELGAPHGWAVVVGTDPGPDVRHFLRHLARFSRATGFTLACVGGRTALRTLLGPDVRIVERLPTRSDGQPEGLSPADRRALTVVAACPMGAPLVAALRLGLSEEAAQALATTGPDGTPWIVLSRQTRREMRDGLDARARRHHAAELFDAWPPDGWGYLRRSHLAVRSGDRTRLRAQNLALFAGFATVGWEFLQRHVAAMADSLDTADISEASRRHHLAAHLAAARLAPRLRPAERARTAAVHHLRRARSLAEGPVEELDLTAELANVFALTRTEDGLATARRLYDEALAAVASIQDRVQRTRVEIILLNGLALVEYFEGNNHAALELEERAERLAYGVGAERPELTRWAVSLIGLNTAKLLTVRFGDRRGAIAKLTAALATTRSSPEDSRAVRGQLARLHFLEGDYPDVIRVLDDLYPDDRLAEGNQREEFRDRLLLALARLNVGDAEACQAQVGPLRLLATRIGSDLASAIVDVLARSSPEASDRPEAVATLGSSARSR
ncbi:hypothetical protein LX15_004691 [Streptoalloteichus tenebrarius]|uniref:Uncharacterized protein n=1 Tax=Streptoalloteichus tenebrarius (strain ATCC 17920 / DSM 40477 / JCM 4838 / CBS 697.72 / NBRC 16177 / NCIMB 11028 / NRRL B-12390 / A12253. 1 / ISP 5477) TaxID=1933 RepID=A0ABT1HZR0_STRSD|nr:hypothetical protein [Streptoalloteichus tenebrarius]MCP2260971.1 hypothetical protein [Streptoalloteichus tenebrarius]BFE98909.1 hypothetical protein GCM10020241_05850 [Streptoalloteichus tenebrarius]